MENSTIILIGFVAIILFLLYFLIQFYRRVISNRKTRIHFINEDNTIDTIKIKVEDLIITHNKKNYNFVKDCVIRRKFYDEIYYFVNDINPIKFHNKKVMQLETSPEHFHDLVEQKLINGLLGNDVLSATNLIIIGVGLLVLVLLIITYNQTNLIKELQTQVSTIYGMVV